MIRRSALYLIACTMGCDVAYPNVEMDLTPRVSVVRPVAPDARHERVVLSTVMADADVWVSTLRSGRVEQVRVDVGSTVARGDTLLTLDAREARANVQLADASVADAVATRDDAKAQLKRVQALGDGASRANLQGAETAVARTQAGVARAVAQRELARTELAHRTLAAPVAGVVSATQVEVGQTASAGAPAIRLVDPERTHVVVGLTADEVGQVRQEGVRFTVRREGTTVQASLRHVAVAADPRTLTWDAELALETASFPPGTPVEVVLAMPVRATGVAVPPSTVYEDQVWVVRQGVASRVAVEIVGEGREGLFITGIGAQEQVVAHGATSLTAGDAVQVVEMEP